MAEVVNRFSKLAEKQDFVSDASFEKAISDAVESAVACTKLVPSNTGKTKRLKVTSGQNLSDGVRGADGGAMIGDMFTNVVEAIQPMLVKSVTVAVSAAVSMAFKQMRRKFEAVDEMKKEAVKVNEELTRLRARVQTQYFAQDRLEQYSRKESVRIYGIPESTEGEATREHTNEIVLKIATKIGANITSQDVSVSHRIGRRGRGSKPRPIIAKFVRRDCKSDMMRCKKKMRQMTEFQGVYINDDLTALRSRLVYELKCDAAVKKVWSIDVRIFCVQDENGQEVRKVVESPEDLFGVGWSEERVAALGLYQE